MGGLLAVTLLGGVGCSRKNLVSNKEMSSPEEETEAEEKTVEKEFEGVTLPMLNFSSATPSGFISKTCKIEEEKFGFKIKVEPCNSDNIVNTRLSTGECPDLLVYNTGSMLYSLNPS